jgi:hypothetical protein
MWSFTEWMMAMLDIWKPKQQKAPASYRSSIYRSISELTMDRFLKCLCEQDYTVLGSGSPKELEEAWILILSQYYELKEDTINGVEEWRLTRDIQRLQSHLYLVAQCLDFLKKEYSASIADSLKKLGYSFNPEVKEPEAYLNLLLIVANKSKAKYIQLQQLLIELDRKVKSLTDKNPQAEDFEITLIHIEEMQKVSYSMDQITVYKYVMLEKKLAKRIELQEVKIK